jgi:tRNA threonylcarbamoyladenosine dehydratase
MFRAEAAEALLSGAPAYVLDCIDDVTTKCELLAYCARAQLPVMSSMGAALKCDPSRLHIGTLMDATRDPLAAKIKWRLKVIIVTIAVYYCRILQYTSFLIALQ